LAKRRSDQVAFLLIDGYSLLGLTTEITHAIEPVTEETHALGDTWVKHEYVNLKRTTFAQSGFYDDAANQSNAALVSTIGSSRVLCYGLQGNTIGSHFVGFSGAMQANYERIASRGTLHRANANYQGDGQVDEGKILHALGTQTTAGNTQSTSVDNAASTSAGGAGFLQISALTLGGYDNVVVKVRQSTNNSTWVDLMTFTAATARTAERVVIAGSVGRYLAVSWAYTGTGSSPSVTFMAGFARF
jgi:hypothetical protein